MDRFIADAGKKTILFNAGEGGESGLSEKLFGTIFFTMVITCSRGGIVEGLFIRLEECRQITLC